MKRLERSLIKNFANWRAKALHRQAPAIVVTLTEAFKTGSKHVIEAMRCFINSKITIEKLPKKLYAHLDSFRREKKCKYLILYEKMSCFVAHFWWYTCLFSACRAHSKGHWPMLPLHISTSLRMPHPNLFGTPQSNEYSLQLHDDFNGHDQCCKCFGPFSKTL